MLMFGSHKPKCNIKLSYCVIMKETLTAVADLVKGPRPPNYSQEKKGAKRPKVLNTSCDVLPRATRPFPHDVLDLTKS